MKNSILSAIFLFLSILANTSLAQLPEGFDYTLFSDQIQSATTIEFAENGNIYVGDQMGRVWVFVDGELQPDPVLDISDEVGGFAELGCLGFVLDPDFLLNGYLYMSYIVDRHHLLYHGTDEYDPSINTYYNATIGRVSRFQVQLDDYATLVPGSQTILFGEGIHDGNASLTYSHGSGDILFGEDGTLIFSVGDGNTFENNFAGGDDEIPPNAYDAQGLIDGIITPEENVGAFRAQQIHSYSGKVFRIDPETGEGIPSNPFYDPENPDQAQSKVWALGLRNPYRMTLRKGTGSANPADGQPGTLYISDVGSAFWEEINVSDGPGYNFGWPLYEGMGIQGNYYNKVRKNLFQPNPFQPDGCPDDYFIFQDLIQQENGTHNYFFENPCNSESNIANYADVFHHTRPVLSYRNTSWNPDGSEPLVPGFDSDDNAIGIEITNPDLEVDQVEDFGGIAAMVGDFYSAESFPEEYHEMLAVLDYSGWLKAFWFDENHNLIKMEHWMDGLENVVDVKLNPFDGCYYTVGLFPSEIHKLCFAGNLQPVVSVDVDPPYGPGPLNVTFDASETYDPEGDPLTFAWDFGDGDTDDGDIVSHTYTAPNANPLSFTATLTVSDTAGNSVEEDYLISLNNSPPAVNITSIEDDQLYSMESPTALPMEASVVDAEHSGSELSYDWRTYLHHNTHFHPLGDSNNETDVFIANPVGCEEFNDYYYRISLRVTDAAGLEGYDELFIYPDCDGILSTPDSNLAGEPFIFPNPARDAFAVRLPNSSAQFRAYEIQLFDVVGNSILERSFVLDPSTTSFGVDVSTLTRGSYVVKITHGDQQFTRRVILAY